ncbi:unnamed protein product [Urochloa humidicola]
MAAASRCLARDRRRRIGDGDLEGDGGIPGGAIIGDRANARAQRRIEAATAAALGNLPHAAPRPCSFAAVAPPLLRRPLYVLIFVWIQYSGFVSASHGWIKIASLPPNSSILASAASAEPPPNPEMWFIDMTEARRKESSTMLLRPAQDLHPQLQLSPWPAEYKGVQNPH